jgi:hypothetical protein
MYWDEVNARTCDKSRWCVGDINEDSPISVKANAKEMNGTVKFQHTTGKGTSRPGGQRHEEPFVCFVFVWIACIVRVVKKRERMNVEVSKSQKAKTCQKVKERRSQQR